MKGVGQRMSKQDILKIYEIFKSEGVKISNRKDTFHYKSQWINASETEKIEKYILTNPVLTEYKYIEYLLLKSKDKHKIFESVHTEFKNDRLKNNPIDEGLTALLKNTIPCIVSGSQKDGFRLMDKKEKILIPKVTEANLKTIEKSSYVDKDIWKEYYNKSILINAIYKPYSKEKLTPQNGPVPSYTLNTYVPPTWEMFRNECESGIHPLIAKFIKHIFNSKESMHYTLQWIADLKIPVAQRIYLYLLSNVEGVGKGTLIELSRLYVGSFNYVLAKNSALNRDFNAELVSRQIIHFDEANFQDGRDRDALKAFNNAKIAIERKGVDRTQEVNYAALILTNNNYSHVKIEPQSRRFAIPDVSEKSLKEIFTPEEFDEFFETILSPVSEFENKLESGEVGFYDIESTIRNDEVLLTAYHTLTSFFMYLEKTYLHSRKLKLNQPFMKSEKARLAVIHSSQKTIAAIFAVLKTIPHEDEISFDEIQSNDIYKKETNRAKHHTPPSDIINFFAFYNEKFPPIAYPYLKEDGELFFRFTKEKMKVIGYGTPKEKTPEIDPMLELLGAE